MPRIAIVVRMAEGKDKEPSLRGETLNPFAPNLDPATASALVDHFVTLMQSQARFYNPQGGKGKHPVLHAPKKAV